MKTKAINLKPGDRIIKRIEWGDLVLPVKAKILSRELSKSGKQLMLKAVLAEVNGLRIEQNKRFSFRVAIDSTVEIERVY